MHPAGSSPRVADQVDGGEVVAVIFLFIRTFLLAEIDGAAHAGHAHPVFDAVGDAHRQALALGSLAIAVVERGVVLLRSAPLMDVDVGHQQRRRRRCLGGSRATR